MADLPDFADVIARLKAAGWTQTALAGKCGITQQAISSIASGATRNPHFQAGQRLLELAGGLDVPVGEPRPISCAVMPDGRALINIGNERLDLSAAEVEALRFCLGRPSKGSPPSPSLVDRLPRGPRPVAPAGARFAELASSAFRLMAQARCVTGQGADRDTRGLGRKPEGSSEQRAPLLRRSETRSEPRSASAVGAF